MKMRKWLMAMTALCCLLTAGCKTNVIENEPDSPGPETDGKETTLTFEIMQNNYTRTDDSDISSLTLAFYRIYGDTRKFIYSVAAKKENSGRYTAVMNPKYLTPNAVVAFANISMKPTEDVLATPKTITDLNTKDGMVMSNAVYYDTSSDTKALVSYTSITADHLAGKNVVNLYLDRIGAKVNVSKANDVNIKALNCIDAYENERVLNLVLKNWEVFGTDKSSYLLKNCSSTYADMETELGTSGSDSWQWNNLDNHTFSWAHSENWNKTAADYPAPGAESESSITRHLKLSEISNTFGEPSLYHETTRPASVFEAPNARPSVIITGQYTINNATPQDLYRKGNYVFTFGEMANYLSNLNYDLNLLYSYSTKRTLYDESKAKNAFQKGILEFKPITNEDGLELPNLVTIQLNKEKAKNANLDDICNGNVSDNTNHSLTDDDIDNINSQLREAVGAWEIYEEGYCFFHVPIEHSGKQFDTEGEKTGSYGLVRNHSYNITIKNISGIGIGVKKDAYLGAWPNSSSNSNVGYSIAVNSWTEVNQDIDIK